MRTMPGAVVEVQLRVTAMSVGSGVRMWQARRPAVPRLPPCGVPPDRAAGGGRTYAIEGAQMSVGVIEAGDAAIVGASDIGVLHGAAPVTGEFAEGAQAIGVALLLHLAAAERESQLFGGGKFGHGLLGIGQGVDV